MDLSNFCTLLVNWLAIGIGIGYMMYTIYLTYTIMGYLRKTIKYVLWLILAFFVVLIVIGVVSYRFDVVAYMQYLNSRTVDDISLSPGGFVRLFVPAKPSPSMVVDALILQEEQPQDDEDAIVLDTDFEDFFGGFRETQREDIVLPQEDDEDFGFVVPDEDNDPQTTDDNDQDMLLESLRQRELLLQQTP